MTSRSGGSFSGRFESRSRSGTRPTLAIRIRRFTFRPARFTETTGGAAVGRLGDRERQLVGLEHGIRLGLASLAAEDLAEVALAVEQAHARHAERPDRSRTSGGRRPGCPGRRRRSGGSRSARTRPRSTRCARRGPRARAPRRPAARRRSSSASRATIPRTSALQVRILGRTPEPLGRNLAEEPHRVAAHPPPGVRIDPLEERAHVGAPRPTQVVGEGEERKQLFGYAGNPKCLFEDGCQSNRECTRATDGTSRCGSETVSPGHRRHRIARRALQVSRRARGIARPTAPPTKSRRRPSAASPAERSGRARSTRSAPSRSPPRTAATSRAADHALERLDEVGVVGLRGEPAGETRERLLAPRAPGRPRAA